MVVCSKELWDSILDDVMIYHLKSSHCPCCKRISCIVERSSEVVMSRHCVTMQCKILKPSTYGLDFSHEKNLTAMRCAHDCVNHIQLKMSMSQWDAIGSEHHRFVVLNASVEGNVISTTCRRGGIVHAPTYAYSSLESSMVSSVESDFSQPKKLSLRIGELFCGGFSGWSHGAKALNNTKYQMEHVWAVDADPFATHVFAKTHHSSDPIHDVEHLIQSTGNDKMRLFNASVEEHWWVTFAALASADAIVLSPPCQAWSGAYEGPGLHRHDGRATLHGWGCVGMLRPDVAMMEMVGGMVSHSHFALIRSFIRWMGYDIKSIETINANQMAPQNRDRLLLIAINRFVSTNRLHRFWKWPSQDGPSMRSYRAIVPMHERWQQSIPTSEVLQQYMDPKMLPKGRFASHSHKRSKRDVSSYRVRLPQDQFACLMASYGFAQEMPARVLQNGGLYGSLLLHEGMLRFLTLPECVIMQGAVDRQWLTEDPRTNARILGNAIILPHAILGLINIYAFCNVEVERCDFMSVFCQAMSHRLTSDSIGWNDEEDGILFHTKDHVYEIPSTIPMRNFAKMVIQSPIESWQVLVEYGIEVREVMKAIAGPSVPASISLGVSDQDAIRLPMPQRFMVDSQQIFLRVDLPSALMMPVEIFRKSAEINEFIVVLTPRGPMAVKHHSGMVISDVINVASNYSFEGCTDVLQAFSFFGETIDGMSVPSKCMVVAPRSEILESDHLWKSRVVVHGTEQLMTFKGSDFDLKSFLRFIEQSHCKEILQAMGWHFTQPAFLNRYEEDASIFLTRVPGVISVLQNDLNLFLQGFLFVNIIQNVKVEKDPNGVEIQLKLWDHYVWHARLAPFAILRPIVDVWHAVSSFLGHPSNIRLVALGKRLNPDFPLVEFLPCQQGSVSRILKVSVVLELHGGAPPIKDQSGLMRDGIALLYLSNGYDFKTAADVSHAFCKSASVPAIQKALSQYPEEKKLKAFASLAKSLSTVIPEPNKSQHDLDLSTKGRIKGNGMTQKQLNIEALSIKPGYFLNYDGSHVLQRPGIMPSAAGIALMHWPEAKQWLNRAETISQDELAILVIGECHGGGHGDCKRLSVPAYDGEGNPMIVAGCLHNLGCKALRIGKDDNEKVPVGASSIIGFTAFRDEIDGGAWRSILQNPVKSVLELLSGKGSTIQFPTPPWGRTWHDGKKKCKQEDAISMQFHARVSNDDLSKILQTSGQMGIYTVVKTSDKKVSQGFQIVWMEGSSIDLSVLLPKVPYHQGLVRTFRTDGKINRGIRFTVKDFEQGFAALKPGIEKPEVVPANFMFRLSPTPVGATAENIRQWLKTLQYPAKPIRALGDSTWLCASSSKFDDEFLMWGEDMILVKWLAPRYPHKQSPILASVKPVNAVSSVTSPHDKIFIEDPWANWNPSNRSDTALKPKGVAEPTPNKARVVEAPLEDRFKKISDEMVKNQESCEAKMKVMQNHMDDISQKFIQQEAHLKQHEAAVKQEFAQVRSETANQIQSMTDSFQKSLHTSLSRQDQQINSQFAELRNLLLQKPNPAKKAKASKSPEDAEVMEGDL